LERWKVKAGPGPKPKLGPKLEAEAEAEALVFRNFLRFLTNSNQLSN